MEALVGFGIAGKVKPCSSIAVPYLLLLSRLLILGETRGCGIKTGASRLFSKQCCHTHGRPASRAMMCVM
eukprot:scaffold44748_cov37-Prasinocladus_malaysianus.AAC.1